MASALPVLAVLAATPTGAGEPNPFLVQAKVFQQSLDFEKCLKRLEQAVRWKGSRGEERSEIELYSALCKLGLGRQADAERHFERALELEPTITLPPLQGPRVETLFEKVKGRLGLPAPAPPAPGPALVPEAPPPTPPPAVVAAEPHGPRLGVPIAFAAGGAVTVIAGALFGLRAQALAQHARGAEFASDAQALGTDAHAMALAANILYGVAGAALLACLVSFFALR